MPTQQQLPNSNEVMEHKDLVETKIQDFDNSHGIQVVE